MAARVAYASFWVFDNLAILSKLKLLKKNPFTMTISAMFSWFIALLLTLVITIRKLIKLKSEAAKIKSILKSYPDRKPSWEKDIEKNKAATKQCYLTIVKSLGDMMPSGIGSGLSLLLPFRLHDGHAGIGGLISALISCYEVSNKIK